MKKLLFLFAFMSLTFSLLAQNTPVRNIGRETKVMVNTATDFPVVVDSSNKKVGRLVSAEELKRWANSDTMGNYAKYRAGLLATATAIGTFETQDAAAFKRDIDTTRLAKGIRDTATAIRATLANNINYVGTQINVMKNDIDGFIKDTNRFDVMKTVVFQDTSDDNFGSIDLSFSTEDRGIEYFIRDGSGQASGTVQIGIDLIRLNRLNESLTLEMNNDSIININRRMGSHNSILITSLGEDDITQYVNGNTVNGSVVTTRNGNVYVKRNDGMKRLAFIDDETFSSYNLYGTDGDIFIGNTTTIADGFNAVGFRAVSATDSTFAGFQNDANTADYTIQNSASGYLGKIVVGGGSVDIESQAAIYIEKNNFGAIVLSDEIKILDYRTGSSQHGMVYNSENYGEGFGGSSIIHRKYADNRYARSTKGTTAQRPTLSADESGFIYFNTQTFKFEGWTGTAWSNLN